jgi:peptidoglycan/LPS O-acetylase OafA/YrhL
MEYVDPRVRATPQIVTVPASLRGDIDGLRAISILAVVAFHWGLPWVAGGFVGVDVFFVISGYLITSHLLKEWERTGRLDLPAFWARRVRRLMPAFAVVLASTLALAPLLLERISGEIVSLSKAAAAATLLVANQYFLHSAGDYFGAGAETNPLLHTWSLSVEEQYYLVWPLLLAWVLPRIRRRSLWVGASLISCFALSLLITNRSPVVAFYTVPARAWELLAGASLAALPLRNLVSNARIADAVAAGGLMLIAGSCLQLRGTAGFPAPNAAYAVLGAVLIIAAGVRHAGGLVNRLLSVSAMTYIGRISYPWYLWHWPLLVIARSRRLYEVNLPIDGAMIALSFILAVGTYHWVEIPARRLLSGRVPTLRILGAGFGTSFVLLSAAMLTGAWANFGWGYNAQEAALSGDRSDLAPLDCLLDGSSNLAAAFRSCAPHVGSGPSILLLGDSHANHWRPAFERVTADKGVGFGVYTMRACLPLPGPVGDDACVKFNQEIRAHLREWKSAYALTGVILAARWADGTGVPSPAVSDRSRNEKGDFFDARAHSAAEALLQLERSLEEVVTVMEGIDVKVLVILPSPLLHYPSSHCRAVLSSPECGIDLKEFRAFSAGAETAILNVVKRHANVRALDPKSFMCSQTYCPPVSDGISIYTDDEHVSRSYTSSIAGRFTADVDWLMSGPQ